VEAAGGLNRGYQQFGLVHSATVTGAGVVGSSVAQLLLTQATLAGAGSGMAQLLLVQSVPAGWVVTGFSVAQASLLQATFIPDSLRPCQPNGFPNGLPGRRHRIERACDQCRTRPSTLRDQRYSFPSINPAPDKDGRVNGEAPIRPEIERAVFGVSNCSTFQLRKTAPRCCADTCHPDVGIAVRIGLLSYSISPRSSIRQIEANPLRS